MLRTQVRSLAGRPSGVRYASKKAGGSSANGRDSNPKYLGQKVTPGAVVRAGNIIRRQRGTQLHAGERVGLGRDHTLYATADGIVRVRNDGRRRFVDVEPLPAGTRFVSDRRRAYRGYRYDLEPPIPSILLE